MMNASSYSGIVRLASGNVLVTIRHFHTVCLACCAKLLSLWLSSRHKNKLPGTLFETHVTTPKSRNTLWLLGFRVFELPVKGSFQLSLTLLVRYRTQGVFKVGGWCPPISWLVSSSQYSRYHLVPFQLPLRDFHPLRYHVPENFKFPKRR